MTEQNKNKVLDTRQLYNVYGQISKLEKEKNYGFIKALGISDKIYFKINKLGFKPEFSDIVNLSVIIEKLDNGKFNFKAADVNFVNKAYNRDDVEQEIYEELLSLSDYEHKEANYYLKNEVSISEIIKDIEELQELLIIADSIKMRTNMDLINNIIDLCDIYDKKPADKNLSEELIVAKLKENAVNLANNTDPNNIKFNELMGLIEVKNGRTYNVFKGFELFGDNFKPINGTASKGIVYKNSSITKNTSAKVINKLVEKGILFEKPDYLKKKDNENNKNKYYENSNCCTYNYFESLLNKFYQKGKEKE